MPVPAASVPAEHMGLLNMDNLRHASGREAQALTDAVLYEAVSLHACSTSDLAQQGLQLLHFLLLGLHSASPSCIAGWHPGNPAGAAVTSLLMRGILLMRRCPAHS